jgi:hypothetical protein
LKLKEGDVIIAEYYGHLMPEMQDEVSALIDTSITSAEAPLEKTPKDPGKLLPKIDPATLGHIAPQPQLQPGIEFAG